jgi:outer membrane lipoprotein carrier protein
MTKRVFSIFAAAAVVACGGGEPAPEPGASAPAEVPGAQASGDTGFRGMDGVTTDPGTEPGPGAVPATGSAGGAQPGNTPPAGAGQQAGAAGGQPGSGAQAPAPSAGSGGQQAADEGAAMLRRASAAYENVRSLQADFVMQMENPLLRQRTTSRGTLYQRQPDRIALRFSEPAGDLILGDGEHFYMYQPSNNPAQYFRQPAGAAGQTGVNLQAQFVGNPVERFSYAVEGSESVGGRTARIINLVPRQRADYRSLKVWVDERDALVRRFELTEHNGSVRRFDLQNMQVNPSIPDGVFRFTPPAGARAVSAG